MFVKGRLLLDEGIRLGKHLYKISDIMAENEKLEEFPELPANIYEYEINILLKHVTIIFNNKLKNNKLNNDGLLYTTYISKLKNYQYYYEETISSVLYNLFYQTPNRYDDSNHLRQAIFESSLFLSTANDMVLVEKIFDKYNYYDLEYPIICKLHKCFTKKHIQITINKLRKTMDKCEYKNFYIYYINLFEHSQDQLQYKEIQPEIRHESKT
jgi:hypothetical protein